MSLPSNVAYCTVTGRFLSAVADTADAGREPDGVAVTGLTVTFSPAPALNPPVVKNAAEQVTIALADVVCTTDGNGFLLGPDGTPGVMLVASDDPDLDPHGWTWKATVKGPGFPSVSTSFVAPSGGAVDLATVIPVPPSPGSAVSQWQAAVTTTITARDETLAARDEVRDLIENGGGTGGAVGSVNGKTGAVTLTAEDVGALPSTYAPAWGDVTGKPSTFAPSTHSHGISGVTGLQAALDDKKAANWTPGVADLPAGSTITVFGNVARPTARTDITVQWVHTSQPTAFNAACDVWLNI